MQKQRNANDERDSRQSRIKSRISFFLVKNNWSKLRSKDRTSVVQQQQQVLHRHQLFFLEKSSWMQRSPACKTGIQRACVKPIANANAKAHPANASRNPSQLQFSPAAAAAARDGRTFAIAKESEIVVRKNFAAHQSLLLLVGAQWRFESFARRHHRCTFPDAPRHASSKLASSASVTKPSERFTCSSVCCCNSSAK